MSTMTPDDGLIQAYLDDELADDDRRALESRFDDDPAWAAAYRRQLDELEGIRQACRDRFGFYTLDVLREEELAGGDAAENAATAAATMNATGACQPARPAITPGRA